MVLFPRILSGFFLACALSLSAFAQDSLIVGFNFGQFIGAGYPATDGTTGDPVGSIGANHKGTLQPPASASGVFRANNNIPGVYDPGYGTWSWDGSDGSSAFDNTNGVDVVVYGGAGANSINSATVHGYNMVTADDAFAGLAFSVPGQKWSIETSTLGYADTTTANNLSFAAFATGGPVTVEWFLDGASAPFATTVVAPGADYSAYAVNLPSAFYGKASVTLQGRLAGPGVVTFDNVQINGSLAQSPVFNTQPQSQTVTVGSTVEFSVAVSGASSPTYKWRRNGQVLTDQPGISGTTTANLVLTNVALAQGGTYTVEVNNNGILAESAGAVLVVQSGPAIVRQPASSSANPGQTVVFEIEASASPAPTFQWQRNEVNLSDGAGISGANTATLTLTGITLASAGDYRVVVSNAAGSATSSVAVLTVTDLAVAPVISTPPVASTVATGATAEFFVVASGAPTPTYRWSFNGEPLSDDGSVSGAATAHLVLANVTTARVGTYTVLVSNSAGSVEATAALTVQVPPQIQVDPAPASQGVLVGSTVNFSVVATGDPAPTYQWLHNGQPILDATGTTLRLENVQIGDSGDYRVRVSNAAGQTESATVSLVVGTAPAISQPPVSQTVVTGARVEFRVTASATPAPAYQWLKNGENIEDATGATFVIPTASPTDAGAYSVRVSNAFGSSVSAAAQLRITQGVNITSASLVQVFPPGSLLSLGLAQDVGNVRYQWFLNGKAIPGTNQPFYVIDDASFADSGTYSLKIYNSQGRLIGTKTVAKVSISVANSYDALLRDPADATAPVGVVRLTVAATGAYTGTLSFRDGKSYALKGRFTFGELAYEGVSTLVVRRAGGLPALELDLSLDARAATLDAGVTVAGAESPAGVGTGSPRATGTVAWRGRYVLSLAPQVPVPEGQPATTARLTATIDAKGVLALSGRLADGTAVKASVPGSAERTYAIFLQPYKNGGHVAGELRLVPLDAGFHADVTSGGLFDWFRPAAGTVAGIDLQLEPTLAAP